MKNFVKWVNHLIKESKRWKKNKDYVPVDPEHIGYGNVKGIMKLDIQHNVPARKHPTVDYNVDSDGSRVWECRQCGSSILTPADSEYRYALCQNCTSIWGWGRNLEDFIDVE